jgi:hypothetical protein
MSKSKEIELCTGNEFWGTISQSPENNKTFQLHHKKVTDLDICICPGLAACDSDGNIFDIDLAPPFVHFSINGVIQHKLKFQENHQLVANVEDASDNDRKVQLVIELGLRGGNHLAPAWREK